jgi:hypothetical protein
MVKQEHESENGSVIFESPPTPHYENNTDDTEINEGNTWENITAVQRTV